MTTTNHSTGTAVHRGSPSSGLRAPAVITPRGRHRPGLIAAGVALAVLGALVAVWLVSSAGDRTDVVVLARDVPFGTTIAAADLSVAWVAVDPSVATVAASGTASVLGKVAGADLVAGSILAPGQLTAASPPNAGEVVVPLALEAERMPAGGLTAGVRLLVVDTPPADADPPEGAPRAIEVRVARVGPPDLNGVSVVDVVAVEDDGPALAARAATGRFALVVLAAREGS